MRLKTLWVLAGVALLALALAGCGGGGGVSDPAVVYPGEVPGANGSIGGVLFSLTPQTTSGQSDQPQGVLDFPYDGEVTLYREEGDTLTEVARTYSRAQAMYQLPDVPPGRYTIRATSRTVATKFTPSIDVAGEVRGIVVRPGIHQAMVNLLLGPAGRTVTFHGTVTLDGAPAPGATVCLRVEGHDLSWLNNGENLTISTVISTTADAEGRYSIAAPLDGLAYELSASNTASLYTWTDPVDLAAVKTGDVPRDIPLEAATPAKFPIFGDIFIFSGTLAAPTAEARSAAAAMRLGTEAGTRRSRRALDAARAQWAAARDVTVHQAGIINTSVYCYDPAWWDAGLSAYIVRPDRSVLGYEFARLDGGVAGPYVVQGQSVYPEQTYFFDSDPQLRVGKEYLYAIRSVAAGGTVSRLSRPAIARAMPQISVVTPNDAVLRAGEGTLAWRAVGDAVSYAVLIYKALPTLNPEKAITIEVEANTLSVPVPADLAPGAYWWGVAAYNARYSSDSTAGSFSAFQRMQVQ